MRSTYRDPLGAAQARIENLQDRLTDAEREAAWPPEVRVRVAALRSWRQTLLETARGRARAGAMTMLRLGALGTAIFTAIVAGMGKNGKPLNALLFGVVATLLVMAAGWFVGRQNAKGDLRRVAELDFELAALGHRSADRPLEAQADPSLGVRIGAVEHAPDQELAAELEASSTTEAAEAMRSRS